MWAAPKPFVLVEGGHARHVEATPPALASRGTQTWLDGNRHFTFLVYLNAVTDGGGQTGFPRLNLTVETTAYSALLFNNCLDNGEPDERTQHEGIVPTHSTKYAINGWMRSKASMGRRS